MWERDAGQGSRVWLIGRERRDVMTESFVRNVD